MIKECTNCQHQTFHTAEVVPGHHGLLLPGAQGSKITVRSRFRIFVCDQCGFVHFFVPPEHMDKVRDSKHFTEVTPTAKQ